MHRILATLLLCGALAAEARAEGLAPGQKALLLLRVLAYDRNFKQRAGGSARVAVVFRPHDPASERERDAIVQALNEVAGRALVSGLPVHVQAVAFDGAGQFDSQLGSLRPTAMVVTTGLEGEVSALARIARDRGIPTVCFSRDLVVKGMAIGLVDRGERAGVVLNLKAAASQAADLDSALAYIAERVGDEVDANSRAERANPAPGR